MLAFQPTLRRHARYVRRKTIRSIVVLLSAKTRGRGPSFLKQLQRVTNVRSLSFRLRLLFSLITFSLPLAVKTSPRLRPYEASIGVSSLTRNRSRRGAMK